MHFTNSLFSILGQQVSPAGGKFSLRLRADHPIYRGHFPDNPITPGVCSLEIIREIVAMHFSGVLGPSTEVESIKFLGFLNPLRTPEVNVELRISQLEQGIWRVRGMLGSDQGPAVKMVARYQGIN
ncbi:MAG: hypothetical protein AAFN92_05000 [Bacteroidota bacterium]